MKDANSCVELVTSRMLAASNQTAGLLLADTGLIESLSPTAIKDLMERKPVPSNGNMSRTQTGIQSRSLRWCVCHFVFFPAMFNQTTRGCVRMSRCVLTWHQHHLVYFIFSSPCLFLPAPPFVSVKIRIFLCHVVIFVLHRNEKVAQRQGHCQFKILLPV